MRLLDSLQRPPAVTVESPLRVLVMISSPSDMPELAVEREKQLLLATTADMVTSGQLHVTVLDTATLTALQRALLEDYHVFHFIGHGGFDDDAQEGVLVLEKDDGTQPPRLRQPPRHPAARRPQHAARRPQRLRGRPHVRARRLLRRRPGPRAPGPAGRGRHADRDLRPRRPRLQPRVLLVPHPGPRHRRRHVRGPQGDGRLRRGLRVGHRRAAPLRHRPALHLHERPPRRPPPRPASSRSTTRRGSRSRSGAAATALPLLEQITAESPDYKDATLLLQRVRPSVERAGSRAPRSPTPSAPRARLAPHEDLSHLPATGPSLPATTPRRPRGPARPAGRHTPRPHLGRCGLHRARRRLRRLHLVVLHLVVRGQGVRLRERLPCRARRRRHPGVRDDRARDRRQLRRLGRHDRGTSRGPGLPRPAPARPR